MASSASQVRTVTPIDVLGNRHLEVIVITWTAHTDGTFTSYAIGNVYGTLERMVTNPGSTAPQANYDITITDADGFDVLGGTGANRHETNTEEAAIAFGTYFQRTVAGPLTLNISGNNVNGATGTVSLYVKR